MPATIPALLFGRGSRSGRLAAGEAFALRTVVLGVVGAGSVAPAAAFAADNLPPVNTVPASLSVNEDSNLTLSGADAISVSDPDAGDAVIEVALSATFGILTLGGTTGLTFTAGDGTGDPTMTFQETVTDRPTRGLWRDRSAL
jgi:hypothetical protein